jgi:hypothetical protein
VDALFAARRIIERQWHGKDRSAILLALDWAKAFDSVCPRSLCKALHRFGLPKEFIATIEAIYTDRRFLVADSGYTSSLHSQAFGISQGCPLSPFLFVIVMTVVMHDARESLLAKGWQLTDKLPLHDLLYADDTLIIEVDSECLQAYMAEIEEKGSEYGLSLNWNKVEAMLIKCSPSLQGTNGLAIASKDSIVYLGATLSADGRATSELNRRIGMAFADFKTLSQVWNHSNLTRRDKLQFFNTLIVSKLMYALETTWLLAAERRHLDGFYCKCLRRVLGIMPPHLNRVSNKTVLERCQAKPLSSLLLCRQLLYYGKLARLPVTSELRGIAFQRDVLLPVDANQKRDRGRPRQNWITEVHRHAVTMAGSQSGLEHAVHDAQTWRIKVRQYCLR